jgi:dienelactone hydrolase
MNYLRSVRVLLGVIPVVAALWGQTALAATTLHFSSPDKAHPFKLSGKLYLPESTPGPCPAVVIVHGTMGVDSRGEFYRAAILKEGIAILEVDFKSGIYSGPLSRPSSETLVPMGFAALRELRRQPAIDPSRIAIMGFSMGGHLAVTTAFEANRKLWMGEDKGFAAHVAFYPVCSPFLRQGDCTMTGAPLIILYGTEDAYGDGKNVPEFKRLLAAKYNFAVTTVEYAGAHHGFNRNEPAMSYRDPAAIGWKGYMAWDGPAANDSLTRVADFLRSTLAAK